MVSLGIIITVSVLVAAGIAVYESPEIRRWLNNSRRRIAVALYNLGDEIHPTDTVRDDISLTEDTSEDAQARRQRARDEISQKAAILTSRRKTSTSPPLTSSSWPSWSSNRESGVVSFDTLVDGEGKLRSSDNHDAKSTSNNDHEFTIGDKGSGSNGLGVSTAVDLESSMTSASAKLLPRNVANSLSDNLQQHSEALFSSSSQNQPHALTESRLQAQSEMFEDIGHNRLGLTVPIITPEEEAWSHHTSESLIDLTPTSEFPGTDTGISDIPPDNLPLPQHQQLQQQQYGLVASEYFSLPSSPAHSTDTGSKPEYYYAHPSNHVIEAGAGPVTSNAFENHGHNLSSSLPSVQPGSLSHHRDEDDIPHDVSSDGTLSDWGHPSSAGIATPASWSEVGSVVSGDDGHHP